MYYLLKILRTVEKKNKKKQKKKKTKKKKKKKQVAQRATIAHLSPMCQGQISFQKTCPCYQGTS